MKTKHFIIAGIVVCFVGVFSILSDKKGNLRVNSTSTEKIFSPSASTQENWKVVYDGIFIPNHWDNIKNSSFFQIITLNPGTYRVDAGGISNVLLRGGRLVPIPPEGKFITRNKQFNAGIIIPMEAQGMLVGKLMGVPGMNNIFPIGKQYSFTVPKRNLAAFYLTSNLNERWGKPSEWARCFTGNKGPGWKIKISKLTHDLSTPSTLGKWEDIGNFPIYLSGNAFNQASGAMGAQQGTAEKFVAKINAGYEYRVTLSGEYDKFFWRRWQHFTWRGRTHQAQNVRLPFPKLLRGAIAIRIGTNNGLHPPKGSNTITYKSSSNSAIYVETNFNREIGEYFDPTRTGSNAGGKLKNSTLSIKIERRTI